MPNCWLSATATAVFLSASLLPRAARAQGSPCPLNENSTAQRSCGPSLCFANNFGDFGVLQRGPARAAYYGSTGAPPVAGAAVSLTLAGVLDDGSTYNKSFATTSMADGTWKILLDAMPAYGQLSATVSCAACGGSQAATLRNQTFGDVWIGCMYTADLAHPLTAAH